MSYSKTKAKASRRLILSLPNGDMRRILTFFFNGDGGFQVVPVSPAGDSWNLFQIGDRPSAFFPRPTYLPTHYQRLPDGELPKFHYHKSGMVGIRGTSADAPSLRQHFASLQNASEIQLFSYSITDLSRLPEPMPGAQIGDLLLWSEIDLPYHSVHIAAIYYSGEHAKALMKSAKGKDKLFYVRPNSGPMVPFFPLWPMGIEGALVIRWSPNSLRPIPGKFARATLAGAAWGKETQRNGRAVVATRGSGEPFLSILNKHSLSINQFNLHTAPMRIRTGRLSEFRQGKFSWAPEGDFIDASEVAGFPLKTHEKATS
jgi:hypothetical protein